jgi:hypothetical protein
LIIKDDILIVEIVEQSVSDSLSRQSNQFNSIEKTEENSTPQIMKRPPVPIVNETAASADSSDEDEEQKKNTESERQQVVGAKRHSGTLGNTKFQFGSKGALPSPLGSAHSFDLQVCIYINTSAHKIERQRFNLNNLFLNILLCFALKGRRMADGKVGS